uniref:FAD/NAD(P)-binding domain-containing protein n=1 Tax=Dendroctonus ponderosae TaxID=77166 RepID=A0AAR5QG56_DENPD
MLDQNTSAQLKTLLERLEGPIELVATLDGSDKSAKIQELVSEVAALSDLVTARFDGINARLPMGHEFTSLILALLQTSGYAPKVSDEVLANIKSLGVQSNFDALNLIAIYNPGTTATMIDGAFFQEEVEERKIMAVPMVFQDNQHIGQGRMTLEEIIAKLDSNAATKDAEKLNAKDAFDVLVIGGGPAGNTSAIYAARKGIKTGIVAERMGGQVMDTMDIENFTS